MANKVIGILGASGGIGAAMVELLAARDDVDEIHATSFSSTPPELSNKQDSRAGCCDTRWTTLDATDEIAIREWVRGIDQVDWLINCVGMLHDEAHGPEKTIRHFDPDHFQRSMALNCLPTLLLAKYALPALKRSPAGVFATVSAKVGSITDNRLGGWYSYRASKAALNMSLKCLSIEWARNARNLRVVALHPGTTDSNLSKPFQQNVPEGKLFSTAKTAGLLIQQIEQLQNRPSGRFIAYDGEEIPW